MTKLPGAGRSRSQGDPTDRQFVRRALSVLAAAWGTFTGILPHALHHVGPLAGTALVAGAGGQLLFAAIGIAAMIPFLARLRRRFGNWLAPAIGLAVFGVTFAVSTFVIGPIVRGDGPSGQPVPAGETLPPADVHGH